MGRLSQQGNVRGQVTPGRKTERGKEGPLGAGQVATMSPNLLVSEGKAFQVESSKDKAVFVEQGDQRQERGCGRCAQK